MNECVELKSLGFIGGKTEVDTEQLFQSSNYQVTEETPKPVVLRYPTVPL